MLEGSEVGRTEAEFGEKSALQFMLIAGKPQANILAMGRNVVKLL